MSSLNPLVSVLLPSYNHARFLPSALESALAQTYTNIEIVVVDDGSSDGSLVIARQYANRYPSTIRVFTHTRNENRGISATINRALRESEGQYLSSFSSDDILYPDKIERQVAVLNAEPDVGLVQSYSDMIDSNANLMSAGIGRALTQQPDPLDCLIVDNPIIGPTTTFRRACLEQVGEWNEDLVYSDWEMWIKILAHWKPAFLAKSVCGYRVHGTNTSVGIAPELDLRYKLEVLKSVRVNTNRIGGLLLRPRSRALLDFQIAWVLASLGDYRDAGESLRAGFRSDPSLYTDSQWLSQWLGGMKTRFVLWAVSHSMFGRSVVRDWPHSCSILSVVVRKSLPSQVTNRWHSLRRWLSWFAAT